MHDNFGNDRGHDHFARWNYYPRFADYDTNSVSYYDDLAKVKQYLHYLDHLIYELQQVINDILQRLDQLEQVVEDLVHYKHVPAKAVKINSTKDWIVVDNINRTASDGLPSPLVDSYQQLHRIDTGKLESVIEKIIKSIGIRTLISGTRNIRPDDGTCINLGDVSKYDEIQLVYSHRWYSTPDWIVNFDTGVTHHGIVFNNLTDGPEKDPVTAESGQVEIDISGGLTNRTMCFKNSKELRVRVSGANDTWGIDALHAKRVYPYDRGEDGIARGWIDIKGIYGISYNVDI